MYFSVFFLYFLSDYFLAKANTVFSYLSPLLCSLWFLSYVRCQLNVTML